jgi:hypothetical protein
MVVHDPPANHLLELGAARACGRFLVARDVAAVGGAVSKMRERRHANAQLTVNYRQWCRHR